jgi:alkanesulfonate monooxygenase SsuD/methylene tetrahydromethanopterin reductase-like flavin-dependent oxidoreductase (luciferase family)
MRFAIWPSHLQPWADIVDVVQHAEATGWDAVYYADHFMDNLDAGLADVSPVLESTAVLSALATLTTRIELGSLVLGTTYRHPAVLANWAATADHISNGRLVLGVGAGWQRNEHEQYGIQMGTPGRRLRRFVEALDVINALLYERCTTMHGDFYQLTDASAEPKPIQDHIPLLIGGKGDRMLGIVARYADRWNIWGLPALLAERSKVLDTHCQAIDRDPSDILRSCQAVWVLERDTATADARIARAAWPATIRGTTNELQDTVDAWAKAGIGEIVVPDFSLGNGHQRRDRLDYIQQEIAPTFK